MSLDVKPILIADDSEKQIELLKQHLNSANIRNPIQSVKDEEQVVCYLKGEGRYEDRKTYPYPILLLANLRMSLIDGFEILNFLRLSEEHCHLPVIVLCEHHDLGEIKKAYQHGANSFITRPIETNDLIITLRGLRGIQMVKQKQNEVILKEAPPNWFSAKREQ